MDFSLVFLLLLFVSLVWSDGRRSHEIATKKCREVCQAHNLQLLDATVSLQKLTLSHWAIKRTYTFHFSLSGVDRQAGAIVICGDKTEVLNFDASLDHF